ncbi:hypothetical protein [Undibacterium luofuense]|uniref:hypothetical protein n=1 Tax=Undibacterium luofuense TaxID=2828733 RepID=UPI0030EBDD11
MENKLKELEHKHKFHSIIAEKSREFVRQNPYVNKRPGNDFDREFKIESIIGKLQFDKVLEAIGSDYDENGIPYWEKH